jgi:hypothetical protein
MSGNVNRVPSGLLSLTDSQTQGRNPDELLIQIRPTLELRDFWLANKGLESEFTDGTLINNADVGATVTVPSGELWAVKNASTEGQEADAATPAIRMSLLFRLPGVTTNFSVLATSTNAITLINGFMSCGINFEDPFFAPAGSTFSSRLDSTNIALVAGMASTTTVLFYRLKV